MMSELLYTWASQLPRPFGRGLDVLGDIRTGG